jgi:DNA polymerase-4
LSTNIIFHVDMDAFFASVEQRNNPHLRGKPVVVGGRPNSRGVVATCSYEARVYGIHSAMSSAEAYRRCPHAIFVHGNFAAYTHASEEVMKIFRRHSPRVDAASIDEAYLDITGISRDFRDAVTVAGQIKADIRHEQGFTCSVGIGPNRQIAKIASGLEKPDGLTCVPPDQVEKIIYPLPVNRIWGVGPVTFEHLKKIGILTVADLVNMRAANPNSEVSRLADALFDMSGYITPDPEADDKFEHGEKSISHGQTLARDVSDPDLVDSMIVYFADKVIMRMQRHGWLARTLTLRLRYADFKTITRDITLPEPTDDFELICEKIKGLVPRSQVRSKKVRLVGVRVSQLVPRVVVAQTDLFADEQKRRREILAGVIRNLRDKFGDQAIFRATTMLTPE